MIAPDMATMLSFVFTDAPIGAAALQSCLNIAVEKSFNAVTVDGDTSLSLELERTEKPIGPDRPYPYQRVR